MQAHINAAKPSGNTKLYDALAKAQEQLDVIEKEFPKCAFRWPLKAAASHRFRRCPPAQ
jgi:hypothetical protein